jgi:serine/threonine-protein kinase RsbW
LGHSQVTILQKSHIQTKTDPQDLREVLGWFDQFQTLEMPHDVWLQCQLALIEGFTNAIRHAHQGLPPETPIHIEVSVSPRSIDIRIWDIGPGFDLEAVLASKVETLNHDSEGGRGLKIMQLVADRLSYQRLSEHQNCLHIQKSF